MTRNDDNPIPETIEQTILMAVEGMHQSDQAGLEHCRTIGHTRREFLNSGGTGDFTKTIQQVLLAAGRRKPRHSTVQSWLRASEALEHNLTGLENRTQAAAAGILIRKLEQQGVPQREAVEQVQAAIDDGSLGKKAAKSAAGQTDDGTTPVNVPDLYHAHVLQQLERLADLAQSAGIADDDLPPANPGDRLVFAAQFLAAIPNSRLVALFSEMAQVA